MEHSVALRLGRRGRLGAVRGPAENDTVPLNFIIHRPGGDSVPVTREPGGDRSILPINTPEIWIVAGDPTIHTSPPDG